MLKTKVGNDFLQPKLVILLVFGIAFVIGMLFAFFLGKNNVETEAEWLDSIMLYLRYGTIYYNEFSLYVLQKRINTAFVLLLVCMTGYSVHILLAGIGVFGLICGYMITRYIIIKGIMGSVFFAISLFPHYICYLYGYFMLLEFMRKKNNKNTCVNQCSQFGKAFEWKNMLPIAVVIIGLLMECYVNPFFVKIFLKIFM